MDVRKETTNQLPTAKGQQGKEEGRMSGKRGEYAEKPVAQKDKPGAREDNHSMTNLDTSSWRVNANVLPFLEQTRWPAPMISHLQALPNIESKNHPLPTHLATDPGLSGYKAKLAIKEEELEVANARFEILQYQFSSLREELQGCYCEDPAEAFNDIRERLEDIAAAIRSNIVASEVPNSNSSVKVEKPSEVWPEKLDSFIDIPEWEEYFAPENSPVKVEKDKLSVFSRLNFYTSFFNIFQSGEFFSRSSPQSTGSNIDTTSPAKPQQPSSQKSDNADNQQASEGAGATASVRELARQTLRQNKLILSTLNRQPPVTSTSSRSHPPSFRPFAPPTEIPNLNRIPLILLYTANIVLFLTLLVAIAWALAAGLMANRERKMWLEGGETARMASVLLQPEGGFWEKGWGVGAGGWGLGGDVEGLKRGYF